MIDKPKAETFATILLEGLSLGIVAVDENCRVTLWNSWMEKHTGIDYEHAMGKNLFAMFPEIKERGKDRYLTRSIAKRWPALLSPLFHEYFIPMEMYKDGKIGMMTQNVKIFPTATNSVVTGAIIVIEDFTEQIYHEREVFRLNNFLKAIRDINQLIVRTKSKEELFRESCKIIVRELCDLFVWIGFINEGNDVISPEYCAGIDRDLLTKITFRHTASADKQTVVAAAATTGALHLVENILDDQRHSDWFDFFRSHGYRSVCALPLKVHGKVIGIFGIHSKEQGFFTSEILDLFGEVTSDMVFALEAFEERKRRQQSEADLRESNICLVEALGRLRQAQESMIREERLSSLGQMTSGIAHDLNNTLMPVLGYAELLLAVPNNLEDIDKARKYLQYILKSASDAAEVVKRLSVFYRQRIEKRVFVPIDLKILVEQTIAITRPIWKDQSLARGVAIDIVAELNEIPTVEGNESELREALANLIFNAVDALPSGGLITACTRVQGNDTVIEICDSGTGMTEKVRQSCFDPFFTTKIGHGSGLGLSMTYGIIQRHGGRIEIKSQLNVGTTFIIYLPISADSTSTIDHKVGLEEKIEPLQILVVDDEPMVLDLITAYLYADGHQVQTATNGDNGLEKFCASNFDLVLTDKSMPGLIGEKLAAAVKQICPCTPVILMTGLAEIIKKQDLPQDIDCLIAKPLLRGELRQAIKQVTKDPKG